MRKKLCLLMALLFAVGIFASCTTSAAVIYENEFDDLDIQARLDDAVVMIQTGGNESYIRSFLEMVRKDIGGIRAEDKRLLKLSEDFMGSVDEIEAYLDSVLAEDGDAAERHLRRAREEYLASDRALNKYKRETTQNGQ